jgi:hypothetical protein
LALWGVRVQIAAAVFTALAAFASWQAVREMRAERVAQERPRVVLDFYVDTDRLVWLQLRNIGRGVAENVSCTFEPVPVDHYGKTLADRPLFRSPIAYLTPGTSVGIQYYHAVRLTDADTPQSSRQFEALVSYCAEGGRQYSDTFSLDFDQLATADVRPDSLATGLSHLTGVLSELVAEMKYEFLQGSMPWR